VPELGIVRRSGKKDSKLFAAELHNET
jgi:hypothetical protein